ncbi:MULTISPECIES: maleylacetoacetate isomerase [unclassified Cupriavidus]|uniref:maleylacetoacetate isomerase n=1 Tax=unclassified Cupriavidus TaxID=2640874 RepID=UPI001C00844C|nr:MULTISPECIES: maleylacetoacetate isomerase [unclassified Cupriavidus]MCA3183026.1 maleylacetoacetate isomerase [Cupriavidus sp.]MCA3190415.1 maleylacetoacetate isomerase [Cupriavidus sp.]MCA3197119.1 maleylacetoacetate isomerase [Cupriavidus sp.]MCA3202396.1 maleylacetoacetate isomerase [Cupriavidus sp.]MCA3205864.1 maleylacetoacetate isomerase [Cupriavidus sp.]
MLELHSYFRSSASFRVRIALNLKGLPYDYKGVHLLKEGGMQLKPEYRALNADGVVPTLVVDGRPLIQSMAIIEYLDETHPEPALLPKDPFDRAVVRGLAQEIACEIHPLNNLRVLKYLKHELKVSEEAKDAWYRHWIEQGFASLEVNLRQLGHVGRYAFGDTPTLVELCLVPQVFNSQRFNVDLTPFPTIAQIHANCMELDAFQKAAPGVQPDSE